MIEQPDGERYQFNALYSSGAQIFPADNERNIKQMYGKFELRTQKLTSGPVELSDVLVLNIRD
jgi:hypothetical protein